MYGCESWTVKKAERRRIDAFELWCWRRLLRIPWTARRSNQSILKEIAVIFIQFSSVQLLSCVQLCHPMDCSAPGFPILHQLPKLAQTHVHLVGDAIQPSHPLSSPSPPSCNLFPASGSCPVSQFFTSGGQNIGVSASTSVLPMKIQERVRHNWVTELNWTEDHCRWWLQPWN